MSRAEALVNEALQNPTLAALPKRTPCSPVLPNWSAPTRSSLGGCAIIAPSTTSTRAMPKAALAELDKPLPKAGSTIENAAARRARDRRRDGQAAQCGIARRAAACRPDRRAAARRRKPQILDGQALATARHLAAAHWRPGRRARTPFAGPTRELLAVRGGKVASILWMRAQIFGDLGALAEESGNRPRPSGSTARPWTSCKSIILGPPFC